MRLPLPKMRRHRIALALIVPTLTALLLIGGVLQWSPLNCWHDEIDINTGRYRYTRFLLYCKIVERTDDTWLSRAHSNHHAPPEWRRVNTFSPGVHYSPHYYFHGALHQIRTLERIESIIPFDAHAKRKIADTLLTMWQDTGSYFGASQYVHKVAETAFALHDDGASIVTASSIPDR